MAQMMPDIPPALRDFIARQHIFFTASATADSRVNISPRGTEALRVLGANQVCYLDQTGSGNETSAHMRADGRITIMLCAFEGAPLILRLYGRGHILPRGTEAYASLLESAFDGDEPPGARQIVLLDVDLVQTSCGYAVPLFDYVDERDTLRKWAERKGEDGLREYWQQKNLRSIDGLPTVMADTLAGE